MGGVLFRRALALTSQPVATAELPVEKSGLDEVYSIPASIVVSSCRPLKLTSLAMEFVRRATFGCRSAESLSR